MKKAEYIAELKRRLANFSPSEVEDAVSYCEEYFEEAGDGDDQQVIDDLGTPAQFAAQLKAERSIRQEQQHRNYRRGNNPNSSLKKCRDDHSWYLCPADCSSASVCGYCRNVCTCDYCICIGRSRYCILCLYIDYRDTSDGKCCYKLPYAIQCMDCGRWRIFMYWFGLTAFYFVFFTHSYRAACVYQCTDTAVS